ncbi:helix-turn-helix domain-containing protein [Bradyrhizobium liaoningense]|uniref:helix-turn-helix domain-containing protein n=1 Tax=Bradyrhizobium liaoningense TaxID=43992 RepID=UPI001BA5E7B9|nr:helix-turn-helix domain-containing protein [Bradyrhizobium liaoningense]MBR0735296.1 helix-turn-helix domain-containing protein [Bradyrhizobium liaoningense]
MSHALAYHDGRPALTALSDLERYVASVKIIQVLMHGTPRSYSAIPADTKPRQFKLLTVSEVARDLRRVPATIRRWLRTGKLPYLPGRIVRIDEADLNEFILRRSYRPEETQTGTVEFMLKKRAQEVAEIKRLAREAALRRRMPRTLKKAKRLKPRRG